MMLSKTICFMFFIRLCFAAPGMYFFYDGIKGNPRQDVLLENTNNDKDILQMIFGMVLIGYACSLEGK